MGFRGVYPRPPSSIQIYFRYKNKSYRESINLPPTPKNLQFAEATRKEILRRIEIDTFRFEDFFPKSSRAIQLTRSNSFREVAEEWLASISRRLEQTTIREYRNTLHYYNALDDRPIQDITFREIEKLLSNLGHGGKTFNNILSVGRGIFKYACQSKLIDDDPTSGISRAKIPEPEPDPLDPQDVPHVLTHLRTQYSEGIANYFELAFFLGFRPSEAIALKWEHVDLASKTITVKEAVVRTIRKRTKTGRSRLVELDDQCVATLHRQESITRKHSSGAVFINPETNKPFSDTSVLLEKYWRPTLKNLGIRHRDARQTRHTCATMMLMAGCNIAWSAKQLGHSLEMFLKTYSTWITKADMGRERKKLAEFSQRFHKPP